MLLPHGPSSTLQVRHSGAAACVLLAAFVVVGCAPAMATMQPARLVPAGHFAMSSSVEMSREQGGSIQNVIGRAHALSASEGVTAQDIATVADAANALFAHTPGPSGQLQLTYGASRDLEIGLRGSPMGLRMGLRWQFLRAAPGIYGAIGFGGATYLHGFPVSLFANQAELYSYRREEFDVPIHLGISTKLFHLWFGPKLVYANYRAEVGACITPGASGECSVPASLNVAGHGFYVGAQAGIAIGWRSVWLTAEISYVRLLASGQVNVRTNTVRGGYGVMVDTTFLVPSVGLLVWF